MHTGCAQHGLRPGDAGALARDLAAQLAQLQRSSRELDSSWRMALVRAQAGSHDVWKRCDSVEVLQTGL